MAFWNDVHAHPVRSHEFKVNWNGVLSHTVKSCSKPTVEVNGNEYQVGNQFFKYPGVAKWGDITITFVDDKTTTRNIFQQLIDQGLLIPYGQKRYGGMTKNDGGGALQVAHSSAMAEAFMSNMDQDKAHWDEEVALYGTDEEGVKKYTTRKSKSIPNPMFSAWMDDSMRKGKIGDIIIEQHGVVTERRIVEDAPGTIWRPPRKGGSKQVEKMSNGGPFILESWKLKNAWIKSINFGSLDYSSDELITIEVTISYDWCEVEFPVAPQSNFY
jgi:hypothetical protein